MGCMKPETLRRIKTGLIVGVAFLGVGSIVEAIAEGETIHSVQSIERSVEKDVPGYNPEAFRAAEIVLADFKEKTDFTVKTIEVPSNVREAVSKIKDTQDVHNKGTQLVKKRRSGYEDRFLLQSFAGIGALGLSAFGLSNLTENKQTPSQAVGNSSPAKA